MVVDVLDRHGAVRVAAHNLKGEPMRARSALEFDRRLSFVCPARLADALAARAKEQMTSINSVLRQASRVCREAERGAAPRRISRPWVADAPAVRAKTSGRRLRPGMKRHSLLRVQKGLCRMGMSETEIWLRGVTARGP